MITMAISFVEILSILLIYNIINGEKIFKKFTVNILCAALTSLLYLSLRQLYNVDAIIGLIGGLFINAIIISKYRKKETIVIIIELIISGLVVILLELITTFIIDLIIFESSLNPITYLLLLTIIMFLLIVLISKYTKNKMVNLADFFSKYKIINIIVMNLFMFFLFIKVLASNDLMKTSIVVQITIIGLILVGINVYFYMYLYKTMSEKKKTEIQRSFNPLISELMSKVKANEHEYKNHLNAIFGIAQVANDSEIREKIKVYIKDIVSENEDFSRLLHIENTIVKAVLYNKLQRAEKLGVSCKYDILSNLSSIPVDDSELTVILSNLLNNAIEATINLEKKEINIAIYEEDNKYLIKVANDSGELNPEIISAMFRIGYSTKGEGRGYGLYNVKKIVDKYKGKINVDLNRKVFTISIIFEKNN